MNGWVGKMLRVDLTDARFDLEELDQDRDYLLAGDVFNNDLIDSYTGDS